MKLVLLLPVLVMAGRNMTVSDKSRNQVSKSCLTPSPEMTQTSTQMSPTTISTRTVPHIQIFTTINTQTQSSSTRVVPTPSSSTDNKPDKGSMDEGLPLYAIIGGAAGGGLILIIIVLVLTLCYLIRRLMKAERKESPHICKHNPAVNGDTAQHSPSSEDHTDRSRESPLPTSPVFHNPTYDGEVKSHPTAGASDQDRMYDIVSDEEAKRMCRDPRYSAPPSSHELDASYAYVSHDICRKKAVSVSSRHPRKPLQLDPVASTETSKPHEYSEPIERTAATEESEYSHLQHYPAATSGPKRHSAPLLSSNECTYDWLGDDKTHNTGVRYSSIILPSSALEHPPPAHQPLSNRPVPQQQTTQDHIYHVLESTPPVSPSTAIGSPLPVLPYLSSEPASSAYPQNRIQELYDTLNEVTSPQAIYDTPVDIPQDIYDEVK